MNCKENQLVRYVGPYTVDLAPNARSWIGKTVRFDPHPIDGSAWRVDPPLAPDFILPSGEMVHGNWIEDRYLRPIDGGESPEESTEAMRKLHELPQEVTS